MSVAGGGMLGRFLDGVERAGNRLPHPFMIFVYLSVFVVGVRVASGQDRPSVVHPLSIARLIDLPRPPSISWPLYRVVRREALA